ncbi:hypothetical protein [Sediminispirochaeta bajacaliforniensis]|uniref:hypothetical protein n=1 Tax=Sediminispirochaeta bajacaliforniensis TaxID=148 RepID=UPI00036D55B7|nr:hypothetical protein [Sediminispirochaeta bajacaliforniensis]
MNIIHRISFRTDSPAAKFFEAEGFKIKPGIINGYDIGENDPKWPRIQEAVTRYEIMDFQYKTDFTKKEIDGAEFLVLSPKTLFEYPQPSDDFGYKETTYKPGVGCRKCSVGLEQQKPFSIKKAPKWGKRNILQLNWVFGEYFVSKELKEKLEGKIPGVHFLEVLKYPKGMPLDDIFQMVVEKRVALALPENAAFQICDVCKGKKYVPGILARGFQPAPVEKDFAIAQSQEFFGDGGTAFRITIVSKAVYQLLLEVGIKGVDFIPCSP